VRLMRVEIRTAGSGAPTASVLGRTVLDSNGAPLSQVITFRHRLPSRPERSTRSS